MLTKSDLKAIKDLIFEAVLSSEKRIRNEVINFKNEILKEIKDLREEVTVVTGYKDQIENHETRIEKLEQPSNIA